MPGSAYTLPQLRSISRASPLHRAELLRSALPIRLRRTVELHNQGPLAHSLKLRQVLTQYTKVADALESAASPKDEAEAEHLLALSSRDLRKGYGQRIPMFSGGNETHAAALAVERLRSKRGDYYQSDLHARVEENLGLLNTARVGCCTLADHLMPAKHNRTRIAQKISVHSLARAVSSQAEAICQDHYFCSPTISLHHCGETDPHLKRLLIPSHARYVLFELLKNACVATIRQEEGLRRGSLNPVRMSLEAGQEWTKVRVVDRGGGVPTHIQSNVFSYAFSTSPMQPSDMGRGTDCVTGCGVGLALSMTFARYMGGQLDMEVEDGVGSVFTLTLNHDRQQLEQFPFQT
eukprot:TRINITY_DN10811_c0_g1_i1.p1 TRINITY_DN10811_c0_g1~~TRINITY_DN10811_c0_g1_i1.p1  ORF type:complete len:349 (-),score=80.58 TRINITY_DN10811_c0_g1_i1:316-1362(-)